MTDLATLGGTLAHVWAALGDGVARRDAPCRTAVLATADPLQGGDGRMVVLRRADPDTATVELHSDLRAAKVTQLAANPMGTLVFWLPGPALQIRLLARFDTLAGADAADRWATIPTGPRQAYGGVPAPGTPLSDPRHHAPRPSQADFAALLGHVLRIDTLHLGQIHQRARFHRDDGFRGTWTAP